MKSLVGYLQKHLDGEVVVGEAALKAFSRDASLIECRPQAVVYARHGRDVRRCLLFLSQLAAKGGSVSLTVRGGGSDLNGAAVGEGIVLVMPAYINRLLRSNLRRGLIRAEAGLEAGSLRSLLSDLGLHLSPLEGLPSSATLGGTIANNAFGRWGGKYGPMADQLRYLKVVLANGEEIEVAPLSRRAVQQKMSLSGLEGDIYRRLSQLFLNEDAPHHFKTSPLFETAAGRPAFTPGYDLSRLCTPEGGLNLLPLFAGSQGTLGVVTEAEFKCQIFNGQPQAVLFSLGQAKDCPEVVEEIGRLEPAGLTFINGGCFAALRGLGTGILEDFGELLKGEIILMAEFDDLNGRKLAAKIGRLAKLADRLSLASRVFATEEEMVGLERLRTSLGLLPMSDSGLNRRIWGSFRGAYMPPDKWLNFYNQAKILFAGYKQDFLAFGELRAGHFSVLPRFNLNTAHHRKRFLSFLSHYIDLVLQHGGQPSLERQEGRLLGQFLAPAAGETFELLQTIKQTFDPFGILNPEIKTGAGADQLADQLADRPSWEAFYRQLPRLG